MGPEVVFEDLSREEKMAVLESCWLVRATDLRVTACGNVTCGAILTARACGAESTTSEDFVKSKQGLLMQR